MKLVLRVSTAVICALTFAWPLVVSDHPDQPVFKAAAITCLITFFCAVLALLARRIREKA